MSAIEIQEKAVSHREASLLKLYILIGLTVIVNYYLPSIVKYFYFLGILYAYYQTKDEEFWLAFFIAVSDGVFGFFGKYELLVEMIPGMPGIEIAQFYVILTLLKARAMPSTNQLFFGNYLVVMAVYLCFLIGQSYIIGVSSAVNIQFRLVKLVFPFLLFYSLPRLLKDEYQYQNLFKYLFPIIILSLFAQIFTIINSTSPMDFFGAKVEYRHKILINLNVDEENTYRGIYNEYCLLLCYLGALFTLAIRSKLFKNIYLYLIIICVFLCYFLSATRGYVLGFTVILFLFYAFIMKLRLKNIISVGLIAVLVFGMVQTIPIIQVQMENAFDRMLTLEALAQGDLTAGGTLKRIDVRGPRVMKKWRESALTGWGFSDTFFRYSDMHVANQNMLLHSGILGGLLMITFFIYFNARMLLKSFSLSQDNPYRKGLPVFVIFFCGWFLMHSSTQYYFSYYFQCMGVALLIITYFSFATTIYNRSEEFEKELALDKEND